MLVSKQKTNDNLLTSFICLIANGYGFIEVFQKKNFAINIINLFKFVERKRFETNWNNEFFIN